MIHLEEVIRQLTANAEAVRVLAQGFSDEQAQWKPTPTTWSMKEVMEHVYQEERIDFRQLLSEMFNQPPPPGESRPTADCHRALEGFLSERSASIAWLRTLQSPDWQIRLPAPRHNVNAGDVLASWVEHDYLHMRQMIEVLHAWNEQQVAPYAVQYGGGW